MSGAEVAQGKVDFRLTNAVWFYKVNVQPCKNMALTLESDHVN